jgi:hypothetical protein
MSNVFDDHIDQLNAKFGPLGISFELGDDLGFYWLAVSGPLTSFSPTWDSLESLIDPYIRATFPYANPIFVSSNRIRYNLGTVFDYIKGAK